MKNISLTLIAFAAALCAAPLHADDFDPSDTTRVSDATFTGAVETDGAAVNARVSKNGRFVVFESVATNLVDTIAVTGGRRHCYLYDRQADVVEIVSLTATNTELGADCLTPSVSNDGRYVAFASSATIASTVSLCANDLCHVNQAYPGQHIWVRDRLANTTMLVSQVSLPVKQQQIDADTLQPVVADDPANAGQKVPSLETVTKRIAAVKLGTGTSNSANPRISADGQFIVYDTTADNLALSSVAEPVYATLVGGVDYDTTTGIIFSYATTYFLPTAYYIDANGQRDVYVRDGATYTNSLVSLACQYHDPNKCSIQGTAASSDPVISDDGSTVVFATSTKFLDLDFNNASDIFLVERGNVYGEVSKLTRISNNTSRILAGNGASTKPGMSADGRYIAFESTASNLVSGDTNGVSDVFVFDRKFNRMVLCSKPSSGVADQASTTADISGAGEYVTFHSAATSFGISGGISNAYIGTIVKGEDGDATSCTVAAVSKGSGSGATSAATNATVGMVPRTSIVNGELVRTRSPSVAYQTSATNTTNDADTNGVSDIFQTPICSASERTTDTDGDGTSNCFDQCASDPIAVESDDTDADGVADCEDGCSSDPQKTGAGLCGCGVADTDTDSDGSPDCNDQCTNDPAKTAPGDCGCGIPDVDANGNGTSDCKESTNPTPAVSPTASPVPTNAATPTPTFDLAGFTPPAPRVQRASGEHRVKVTFPTSTVTDPSKVVNFDLTCRRLTASSGTVKRGLIVRRRKILDGVVKLPTAGKWAFTSKYNGPDGTQSQSSPETRPVIVR